MTCEHCGSIGDVLTITSEFDAGYNLVEQGENLRHFPDLEQVSATVRRCRHCSAYYRWSMAVESLQGGPERYDHHTLRRLPDTAALELIERERS
jgi:hypothetical protein